MVNKEFACTECHLILPSKKEGRKDIAPQCPRHPSAPVSLEWQGDVVIMHPTRSEIAKRLKVEVPGIYALKVSTR